MAQVCSRLLFVPVDKQEIRTALYVMDFFCKLRKGDSSVAAFDLLFKTFYILNIMYPPKLQNFYNFIENFIYEIDVNVSNSVTSLHINLINIPIENKKNV